MEIEKIIVKFLSMEANIQELELLEDWLKEDANLSVFKNYVKVEYFTTACMKEFDIDKAKASISRKLKDSKRQRRIAIYKKMAIAASIILFFGITIFRLQKEELSQTVIDDNTQNKVSIEIGNNKAILTLSNGNQVFLEKDKEVQIGEAKSNGEELIYDKEKAVDELLYNNLKIPRGGQFFVQLSDGTKVWLNSDSELKYPVSFQNGKAREVELVYGEAYFEVSPSTDHNGAPFYVHTKSQTVDVLGTVFNIKAYNDEDVMATTLVEGKIRISNGDDTEILKPNQQSKISNTTNKIEVKEVDVSQEISWVKGLFSFNEATLDSIMSILSRWYDFEIVFESAQLKNFVFTGVLERTKSIDDVIKLIEGTSEGQVKFEINDKTITIK